MSLELVIVGGGPAGLSAAAHAQQLGLSWLLLESGPAHANTIQRYQKGKHVMAEPAVVPLRSDLPFSAGTREAILGAWQQGIAPLSGNIRYSAEVASISGSHPEFTLTLADGESIGAKSIVLAIGLQGNPRKLGAPGEDASFVQYTLDDPDEYSDETIVIVGAGDAAIENAIALSRNNSVVIVNRRDEFARAKEGNLAQISRAIEGDSIKCFYNSSVASIDAAGSVILNTETGETRINCDRLIARLGAIPPRHFVESCGIGFPSDDPTTLPELSNKYESNVPGLYVIGALGGYPLIKQAMNQGYEVAEFIAGKDIQPADHGILESMFAGLPFKLGVDETLALIRRRAPLFTDVNGLVLRELVLSSNLLMPKKGEEIFRKNDYTNSFMTIVEGEVDVETDSGKLIRLTQGQFFGEMSLLSGRRRAATVRAATSCVILESPRRDIIRLMNSYEAVRRNIDEHFIVRTLRAGLAPDAPADELLAIAGTAEIRSFRSGDVLFNEGDGADGLHLIRSGSVSVSRRIGGRDIVTSYVAAGNYVGEMGLVGQASRSATVRATVATESIFLKADVFMQMLERNDGLRERVQEIVRERLSENLRMEAQPEAGDLISFLMQQGLGEATDVLLIDETLCIGCDNCEKACAETHGGTSRLDRAAGPSYAQVHVPTSCRHCEDPHCMKDCPPDAIRRAPNGEVYVQDSCIGCGNCERNCPYGVIQMASGKEQAPNLLSWILTGRGAAPGKRQPLADDGEGKKAVKCDMCKDLSGGPACVRACPTGAALRMSPSEFVKLSKRVN
ncbi:MAG: cyclic nucleotide-binding domain-containing protein [Gammaproteobacteria bacterium]|nr:cyclic nucleotide-binding domain-containing protein [Gammaproteobacteria bacterium]